MTDVTREGNYFKKKQTSYFAGEIVEGEGSVVQGSGNYQLANLPAGVLITNAYVFVRTASDAATSAAVTLGTASGGAQILTGANLKTAGKQGTFAGMSDTGTGKQLWLNVAVTGATSVDAKYLVVVEYLEPSKVTGELTNFN